MFKLLIGIPFFNVSVRKELITEVYTFLLECFSHLQVREDMETNEEATNDKEFSITSIKRTLTRYYSLGRYFFVGHMRFTLLNTPHIT